MIFLHQNVNFYLGILSENLLSEKEVYEKRSDAKNLILIFFANNSYNLKKKVSLRYLKYFIWRINKIILK